MSAVCQPKLVLQRHDHDPRRAQRAGGREHGQEGGGDHDPAIVDVPAPSQAAIRVDSIKPILFWRRPLHSAWSRARSRFPASAPRLASIPLPALASPVALRLRSPAGRLAGSRPSPRGGRPRCQAHHAHPLQQPHVPADGGAVELDQAPELRQRQRAQSLDDPQQAELGNCDARRRQSLVVGRRGLAGGGAQQCAVAAARHEAGIYPLLRVCKSAKMPRGGWGRQRGFLIRPRIRSRISINARRASPVASGPSCSMAARNANCSVTELSFSREPPRRQGSR